MFEVTDAAVVTDNRMVQIPVATLARVTESIQRASQAMASANTQMMAAARTVFTQNSVLAATHIELRAVLDEVCKATASSPAPAARR